MSLRSDNGRVFVAREWVATALGSTLIVYESVIEHSAHKEPYLVALVLFGYVPVSMFDRLLGRWAGDRDDPPRRKGVDPDDPREDR